MSQQLELTIRTKKEIDGIEMGVLDNGIPFLTGRGLARICGVAPSTIIELGANYSPTSGSPRDRVITRILADHGYFEDKLCFRIVQSGVDITAYPDAVCMAILEYYAFETSQPKRTAQNAYRLLARKGLREFIYDKVGFDPNSVVPDTWLEFHDRLLLNEAKAGYYSVFSETANIVLDAIRNGLRVDAHVVPDISIGKAWSNHWQENELEKEFGARQKERHIYPDYFPQAAANDVIEAWVYPIDSLGRFRLWLDEHYLPKKYPQYIKRVKRKGAITASRAEMLIALHEPKALVPPKKSP